MVRARVRVRVGARVRVRVMVRVPTEAGRHAEDVPFDWRLNVP